MPLYKYIATAPGQSPHEVVIEAENSNEALSKLRSSGLRPVRFCGETDGEKSTGASLLRRSKVDVYDFTSQLAPLLIANIPLERAMAIIIESCVEPQQRQFVSALRQGLHEGKRFSELVRSYGSVFPGYYANLIESGEESGSLPEVVEELRKFMDDSKELKEFLITSSIYPAVILSITGIVGIVLFTVLVPRFSQIFADMGRENPPSMVFLIFMGKVVLWGLILLVIGLCAGVIVYYRVGPDKVREWRNRIALKLPIFSKLINEIEMQRFIQTLSILVKNHVDIIKTVRIAVRVIQNQVIRESFSNIEGRLKGGEKLSASLSGNEYIPAGTASKIRVGEESGYVGEMLSRVSEHLEVATKRRIKRMLSLFEPAVIMFLAGMVLVVVLSIFLSIMELNKI